MNYGCVLCSWVLATRGSDIDIDDGDTGWGWPGLLVEIQTKVHPKVRNHGEGPYSGLLLVESGYYRFHI